MSSFNAFMAGNAEQLENRKVVVSSRFKDENGEPVPFEIRAIKSDENEQIQKKSYVTVPVQGQRGRTEREFNQVLYTAKLLAASVVYPDLNSAELQDSYGVKTPEALLSRMLYMSEYNRLAEEVGKFSNIENLAEAVEEAKN